MTQAVEVEAARRNGAWLWGAAFVCGMFGVPVAARALGFGGYWPMVLTLLPMLLLIPTIRAFNRRAEAGGFGSPALNTYNRRSVAACFAYVSTLFLAVAATREWEPHGVAMWLLALLPTIPVLVWIGLMGRYLMEEQDEYLRARAAGAALVATGLLLALATLWGFLETFRLVPHVPGWAALPVWAIGLGVGQLVMKLRA